MPHDYFDDYSNENTGYDASHLKNKHKSNNLMRSLVNTDTIIDIHPDSSGNSGEPDLATRQHNILSLYLPEFYEYRKSGVNTLFPKHVDINLLKRKTNDLDLPPGLKQRPIRQIANDFLDSFLIFRHQHGLDHLKYRIPVDEISQNEQQNQHYDEAIKYGNRLSNHLAGALGLLQLINDNQQHVVPWTYFRKKTHNALRDSLFPVDSDHEESASIRRNLTGNHPDNIRFEAVVDSATMEDRWAQEALIHTMEGLADSLLNGIVLTSNYAKKTHKKEEITKFSEKIYSLCKMLKVLIKDLTASWESIHPSAIRQYDKKKSTEKDAEIPTAKKNVLNKTVSTVWRWRKEIEINHFLKKTAFKLDKNAHVIGGKLSFRTQSDISDERRALNEIFYHAGVILLDKIQQTTSSVYKASQAARSLMNAVTQIHKLDGYLSATPNNNVLDKAIYSESDKWKERGNESKIKLQQELDKLFLLADDSEGEKLLSVLRGELKQGSQTLTEDNIIKDFDTQLKNAVDGIIDVEKGMKQAAMRLAERGDAGEKELQRHQKDAVQQLEQIKGALKAAITRARGEPINNFSRQGMLARRVGEWNEANMQGYLKGLPPQDQAAGRMHYEAVFFEVIQQYLPLLSKEDDSEGQRFLQRLRREVIHAADGTTLYPTTMADILAGMKSTDKAIREWSKRKLVRMGFLAACMQGTKWIPNIVALPLRVTIKFGITGAKVAWVARKGKQGIRGGEGDVDDEIWEYAKRSFKTTTIKMILAFPPGMALALGVVSIGLDIYEGGVKDAAKQLGIKILGEAPWSALDVGTRKAVEAYCVSSLKDALKKPTSSLPEVTEDAREMLNDDQLNESNPSVSSAVPPNIPGENLTQLNTREELSRMTESSDPTSKTLAESLLAQPGIDKVPLWQSDQNGRSVYNRSGRWIKLSANASDREKMHEITHALTADKLNYGREHPESGVGQLVTRLDTLRQKAQHHYSGTDSDTQYYLTNTDEFVAGLYSGNSAFINYLKSINTEGESLLLQAVAIFCLLLGLTIEHESALTRAMMLTGKVMGAAPVTADENVTGELYAPKQADSASASNVDRLNTEVGVKILHFWLTSVWKDSGITEPEIKNPAEGHVYVDPSRPGGKLIYLHGYFWNIFNKENGEWEIKNKQGQVLRVTFVDGEVSLYDQELIDKYNQYVKDVSLDLGFDVNASDVNNKISIEEIINIRRYFDGRGKVHTEQGNIDVDNCLVDVEGTAIKIPLVSVVRGNFPKKASLVKPDCIDDELWRDIVDGKVYKEIEEESSVINNNVRKAGEYLNNVVTAVANIKSPEAFFREWIESNSGLSADKKVSVTIQHPIPDRLKHSVNKKQLDDYRKEHPDKIIEFSIYDIVRGKAQKELQPYRTTSMKVIWEKNDALAKLHDNRQYAFDEYYLYVESKRFHFRDKFEEINKVMRVVTGDATFDIDTRLESLETHLREIFNSESQIEVSVFIQTTQEVASVLFMLMPVSPVSAFVLETSIHSGGSLMQYFNSSDPEEKEAYKKQAINSFIINSIMSIPGINSQIPGLRQSSLKNNYIKESFLHDKPRGAKAKTSTPFNKKTSTQAPDVEKRGGFFQLGDESYSIQKINSAVDSSARHLETLKASYEQVLRLRGGGNASGKQISTSSSSKIKGSVPVEESKKTETGKLNKKHAVFTKKSITGFKMEKIYNKASENIKKGDVLASSEAIMEYMNKKPDGIEYKNAANELFMAFTDKFLGKKVFLLNKTDIQEAWIKNIELPLKADLSLDIKRVNDFLERFPLMLRRNYKSSGLKEMTSLYEAVDSITINPMPHYGAGAIGHVTYKGKIEIGGNANYQKTVVDVLNNIRKTPSGAALIENLKDIGVKIVPPTISAIVREGAGGGLFGKNSAGGDVIQFDPKNYLSGNDVSRIKTEPWLQRSPEVALFHEGLHIYYEKYKSRFTSSDGKVTKTIAGGSSIEEESRIIGGVYKSNNGESVFPFNDEAYLHKNLPENAMPLNENKFRKELAEVNNEPLYHNRPFYGKGENQVALKDVEVPLNAKPVASGTSLPVDEYMASFEKHKVISGYMDKPLGSCEAIMAPVAGFMKEKGFSNIKYRAMSIWSNASETSLSNHFAVVGDLNGQTYVFDLTAHQFMNQGMPSLNKPLIMTDSEWRLTYQNASQRKLIVSTDFSSSEAARNRSSALPNSANDPFKFTDFDTLIAAPEWYRFNKSAVTNDYSPVRKK